MTQHTGTTKYRHYELEHVDGDKEPGTIENTEAGTHATLHSR